MHVTSLHDLPKPNTVNEVLAGFSAEFAGLPIAVLPIPGSLELLDNHHDTPRIFVAHSGQGQRWAQRGRVTHSLHTAPRMIEIYEQGLAFDREVWQGEPGRCVRVDFAAEHVQSLTHGRLQALDLQTHHEVFAESISRITLELAEEALRGSPNGQLYVQGLSLSLLGLLSARYTSSRVAEPRETQVLSAAQRRRISELVQSELGGDLSLFRIASEIGKSPQHFARLFKATYGETPHRYVQLARLNAAAAALRGDKDTPISSIAMAFGFSSQSHLTELMRRYLGITPAALRHGRTGLVAGANERFGAGSPI